MNKIVSHGLKIDLHIHSCASAAKDGSKVKNNTLENIPILIGKLNENGVNICAITDHDTFSMDMYNALKKAENDDSSIQKVLPGVEFSVSFFDDKMKEQTIHVVTIFSDKDTEKIAGIEDVLKKYRPKADGAYAEESFLKVLREIDLDTILIAHQKNSLSSRKPRKNDVNYLGEAIFLEIVASDYFEAYEFKNKRNEVLNKNYLLAKGIDDKVRFVTGTDCHDWNVYPKEDLSDTSEGFPFTFAKCLPTFRGLVMALTDQQRLKRIDSFFNADKTTLEYIEIENDGKVERIPLSKGINVIIGDNSIGKSMLLHALSGFEKNGEAGDSEFLTEKKQVPDMNKLLTAIFYDATWFSGNNGSKDKLKGIAKAYKDVPELIHTFCDNYKVRAMAIHNQTKPVDRNDVLLFAFFYISWFIHLSSRMRSGGKSSKSLEKTMAGIIESIETTADRESAFDQVILEVTEVLGDPDNIKKDKYNTILKCLNLCLNGFGFVETYLPNPFDRFIVLSLMSDEPMSVSAEVLESIRIERETAGKSAGKKAGKAAGKSAGKNV